MANWKDLKLENSYLCPLKISFRNMTLLYNCEAPAMMEAKNKIKQRFCAETNRRGMGKMAPYRTTTKWSMSGSAAGISSGHTDILSDWVELFFTKCLTIEDDTQANAQQHPQTVNTKGALFSNCPSFTLHTGCKTKERGLWLWLQRLKVLVPYISLEWNVCPSGYVHNGETEDTFVILSPT